MKVRALVVCISLLYVGISLVLAPYKGFWSGDAGVKLWQMQAWVENGWRTPWADYAHVNRVLDPHHGFSPLRSPFALWMGDRVLTIYTLPYIFVSSLFFAVGGRPALYVLPLIGGMAGLMMVEKLGRVYSRRVAVLAILVFGLATPWLFYSVEFWEHTIASVCILACLVLLFSKPATELRWQGSVAAGMCLGLSVQARPEAALYVAALVIVSLFQRWRGSLLIGLALGLTVMALAGLAYQVVVVGSTTMGQVMMNFDPAAFDNPLWSINRLFEMSQMVVESRFPGVLITVGGSAALLGVGVLYRHQCSGPKREWGLTIEYLGLVLLAVSAVLLALRGHQPMDLLMSAPVVSLLVLRVLAGSSLAVPELPIDSPLGTWCVLVVAMSVLLGRQNGGFQWGPRYLLPLLGPLTLLAVDTWDRLERSAKTKLGRYGASLALVILGCAGMVTQGVGVVRLGQVRQRNDLLTRVLLRSPRAIVVTDVWYVPQIAPEVYGLEPLFFVNTSEEWRELDDSLERQGIQRLRVVQLDGQATWLTSDILLHWRKLEDLSNRTPGVPDLLVTDYVPVMAP